jgi:signal transduction histidine kinase
VQGRYKRDGSAPAEQEPRGGTDRGASPQHTQNQGPGQPKPGEGGDRATARPGGGPAGPGGPGAPATGPQGASGTAGPAPSGEPAPALPRAQGPADSGSRIALRNWRISTRLVSLLTLPVVAATTLGGLRISESMDRMRQLDHMQLLTDMTQEATKLASALQKERDLTAGPLANNPDVSNYNVTGTRAATDRAKKAFLDTTLDIPNSNSDETLESIRANANQIATQVNGLGTIREQAYQGDMPHMLTVESYHRLIESLLSLSQDMAQATSNPDMIKRTRALAAFSAAKEYASMQRAIIAAALPASDGDKAPGLLENDRQYGRSALVNGDNKLDQFKSIYQASGGDADALTARLESGNATIASAEDFARRVLTSKNGLASREKRSHLDWTDDYGVRLDAMHNIEATLLDQMESKARQLREESQQDAIINGALILLVLGVSLVGAFVVARSMIRSLRRLQDTATKVAQERLPELVKQLSEADPQDVDTSVESVGVHSRDEIGKVAEAFDEVHREAVRLAAEQALLRGNVNAMFTNLSRRSQGLIQRQLSLISELESREADPDQLASLFKLDHLATRMRRNGENLLVLAGEEPGRRWTRPVPLVDVLRAAASEVEQYERIELAAVPATQVAGRVVNDLVHLLAELLENATSFSSPQTKVRVTGHALPDGRVLVEIHDTGIGLSPEDLAAINERLASPPTVDVSVSRRMGLFVVGRLSLRHGIRIQLRPSDSGGTTALVMLPVDVAQGGKKPGAPGGPGGPAAAPKAPAPAGIAPGRPAGGPEGRPGGPGGPGSPPGAPGGLLGAGAGPRAALPTRDGGAPPQGGRGGGLAGAFNRGKTPAHNEAAPGDRRPAGPDADRGRGLPPGASPAGELPGAPRPQTTSWGSEPNRPAGPGADTARGHEDPGAFRGPGATTEIPRPDFQAPRPVPPLPPGAQGGRPQDFGGAPDFPGRPPQDLEQGAPGGQFVRSDVFGPPGAGQPSGPAVAPDPYAPGRYAGPDARPPGPAGDPAATQAFPRPDLVAPQPPVPGQAPLPRGYEDHAGAPARGALPPHPQPEALPPATGPGDGRTPLYDTLETDWFRTQGRGGQGDQHGPAGGQEPGRAAGGPGVPAPQAPQPAQAPASAPAGGRALPPVPPRTDGPPANGHDDRGPDGAWRTSPNDELTRQAERVRKPAAGGITTSGLPRRVPRANLVAGTAQEQNLKSGPQVSRAPDDVRGRLTNLRRGIQQGREQNSSTTGSFNLGPTHQQER